MKQTSLTARIASVFALLVTTPALVQAHPGHSAFDWFTNPPHPGHGSEYSVLLNVVAVLILAAGIYRLGTRKR